MKAWDSIKFWWEHGVSRGRYAFAESSFRELCRALGKEPGTVMDGPGSWYLDLRNMSRPGTAVFPGKGFLIIEKREGHEVSAPLGAVRMKTWAFCRACDIAVFAVDIGRRQARG